MVRDYYETAQSCPAAGDGPSHRTDPVQATFGAAREEARRQAHAQHTLRIARTTNRIMHAWCSDKVHAWPEFVLGETYYIRTINNNNIADHGY